MLVVGVEADASHLFFLTTTPFVAASMSVSPLTLLVFAVIFDFFGRFSTNVTLEIKIF